MLAQIADLEFHQDPTPFVIVAVVGMASLAGFIILGFTWLLNLWHDSRRAARPLDPPVLTPIHMERLKIRLRRKQ